MSVLEVSKLNKSFGGTHVLKDVDLSLEKGETMAIIGPSGSGKSTLLRCINCLERAEKGKIILDGITIAEEKDGTTEYLPDEQLRDARLHLCLLYTSGGVCQFIRRHTIPFSMYHLRTDPAVGTGATAIVGKFYDPPHKNFAAEFLGFNAVGLME